jgi:NitT/TauT family transport system substrate-binding protein
MRSLIALALVVGCLVPARAGAEALSASTGGRTNWDSVLLAAAEKQGFFKEEGLDVDVVFTEGGAATLQPAVSGRVDVAFAVGFLGVVSAYAKGAPIRVISAEATGAKELFWYAKADSGIKSLKDAAGKTIAFSVPGTSSNLMLLALLRQENVAAKPVSAGSTLATMTQVMTGQIDIGYATAPFALAEVAAGKLVILARSGDVVAMRDETLRVNVANLDSLMTKRASIERFMRAVVKAIDWAYSDPRAIDNFADGLDMPHDITEKNFTEWYPKSMFQIDEVKGISKVMDEAIATKNIAAPLTQDQITTLIDIVYRAPAK